MKESNYKDSTGEKPFLHLYDAFSRAEGHALAVLAGGVSQESETRQIADRQAAGLLCPGTGLGSTVSAQSLEERVERLENRLDESDQRPYDAASGSFGRASPDDADVDAQWVATRFQVDF